MWRAQRIGTHCGRRGNLPRDHPRVPCPRAQDTEALPGTHPERGAVTLGCRRCRGGQRAAGAPRQHPCPPGKHPCPPRASQRVGRRHTEPEAPGALGCWPGWCEHLAEHSRHGTVTSPRDGGEVTWGRLGRAGSTQPCPGQAAAPFVTHTDDKRAPGRSTHCTDTYWCRKTDPNLPTFAFNSE